MNNIYESTRLNLQKELDSAKEKSERNKLGQYATPKRLSDDIVESALSFVPKDEKIRFIDPAFGTGVFFSSLLDKINFERIESACGYEIDSYYATPSADLWKETPLDYIQEDFLISKGFEKKKSNLLICNPPYVRHHHLESQRKQDLCERIKKEYDIEFSKLSGLYCYFMVLAEKWLCETGIGVWLVPGEFLDVNYGSKLKEFLLKKVNLLRIHKYNPTNIQFDDALVSSTVVFYSVGKNKNQSISFTTGDNINNPSSIQNYKKSILSAEEKWSSLFEGYAKKIVPIIKISDFFSVKRGIATGGNKYFILKKDQAKQLKIPNEYLKPILPSPRHLKPNQAVFINDTNDFCLLNITCDEKQIQTFPIEFQNYLKTVKKNIGNNYLVSNRKPWYKQENRERCPLLITYMGRNKEKPVKFILNYTNATAANGYLMLFPKFDWQTAESENQGFLEHLYNELSHISGKDFFENGRLYGGGLFKLEPKELLNLPINKILSEETLRIIKKYLQ